MGFEIYEALVRNGLNSLEGITSQLVLTSLAAAAAAAASAAAAPICP